MRAELNSHQEHNRSIARQLPPPSPWTPRDLFASRGRPLELGRHGKIYQPGDAADALYWVCWGDVLLLRTMPNGRECTLDHFRPGSIFGEQELILNEDRKATALPRTDVALLVLSRSIVLELQEQVPELVLWMNRSLAASLLRMQNRVESMVFKSAHGNIAEVLVDLARIHGRQTPEGVLIDCPITHQEIASQIGSARETVSYAFMEFRAQGLIATRVRHTFVLDMARLQQIAAE